MNETEIAGLGALALFRLVFGMRQGQVLTEFVKEVGSLREDKAFIDETRAYAVAHASELSTSTRV